MLKIKKNTNETAQKTEVILKQNDNYCPCRIVKNESTKCPCKNFREQEVPGDCKCGLFSKFAI